MKSGTFKRKVNQVCENLDFLINSVSELTFCTAKAQLDRVIDADSHARN